MLPRQPPLRLSNDLAGVRKPLRKLVGLSDAQMSSRFVTPTHVDLGQAVGEGAFRIDLSYRLHVFQIPTAGADRPHCAVYRAPIRESGAAQKHTAICRAAQDHEAGAGLCAGGRFIRAKTAPRPDSSVRWTER